MLEQADCGSRELDAAIYVLINPAYEPTGRTPGEMHYRAGGHPFACPRYSSSIDAALSALPEGHRLNMLKCRRYNGEEWEADIECHAGRGPGGWALGKTPALALITAILKATREAGE